MMWTLGKYSQNLQMYFNLAFEYADDEEKQFRVEQICSIMHKTLIIHNINQKELVLQDVFQTVLDHGSFKMIEELYEFINFLNIKGNSALDNIFFNAIRKHNEIIDLHVKISQREESKIFDKAIEEEDSSDEAQGSSKQKFTSPIHMKSLSLISPAIKETCLKFENLSLINRSNLDTLNLTDKKQLYISPNVNKEIEYEDRKARMKRYFSSTTMKSDYFITSKQQFRKRTFKKTRDMNNKLIQDSIFMFIDTECEKCK